MLLVTYLTKSENEIITLSLIQNMNKFENEHINLSFTQNMKSVIIICLDNFFYRC